MSLVGHELANFLFKRHVPMNDAVNTDLDVLMGEFRELAHMIINISPVTPEQTIALRDLHTAHRSAIFAVVGHQGKVHN